MNILRHIAFQIKRKNQVNGMHRTRRRQEAPAMQYVYLFSCTDNVHYPANKKRFWNVRLWLYEGLGELNVLRMLYRRSTLVI